jgi:hypothetical protein
MELVDASCVCGSAPATASRHYASGFGIKISRTTPSKSWHAATNCHEVRRVGANESNSSTVKPPSEFARRKAARAHHHAISLAQLDAFEVRVLSVAADRRNRSDVLMPMNNRKFQLAAALLRGVILKRVLVRAANPGHFHANQHTPSSRFRQRVFAHLVPPGFH